MMDRAKKPPPLREDRPRCITMAEGPETQVRGRVGDAAQTVLYGVDGLVDSDVPKVKLWKDKMIPHPCVSRTPTQSSVPGSCHKAPPEPQEATGSRFHDNDGKEIDFDL
ncbi:hypothetical protein EYF80_040207 [Liparis tanakae]|uniref:Uncharacterized protein n=1 Tax=Liparis tanakae TaxID=230148 RepID=A0A4Z2G7V2_9TELE|nr:hypothetical protein EYF80_040207 [Liparis tanakae]